MRQRWVFVASLRIPRAVQLYFIPTTTVRSSVKQLFRYSGAYLFVRSLRSVDVPQRVGVGHVRCIVTRERRADYGSTY